MRICLFYGESLKYPEEFHFFEEARYVVSALMLGLKERGHEVHKINATGPNGVSFEDFEAQALDELENLKSIYRSSRYYDVINIHNSVVGHSISLMNKSKILYTCYSEKKDYASSHILSDSTIITSRKQGGSKKLEKHKYIYTGVATDNSLSKSDNILILVDSPGIVDLNEVLINFRQTQVIVLNYSQVDLVFAHRNLVEVKRSSLNLFNIIKDSKCIIDLTRNLGKFDFIILKCIARGIPILTRFGSPTSELVVDGITGLVFEDNQDIPLEFEGIKRINPLDCVEFVMSRYSLSRMVDLYEASYKKLAGGE